MHQLLFFLLPPPGGLEPIVGRKVQPWNKNFPGHVAKYSVKTNKYQLRFYDPTKPGRCAKKLMQVTHEALVEHLLLPPDDDEEEDEFDDEEVEVEEAEEEEEEEEDEEDMAED